MKTILKTSVALALLVLLAGAGIAAEVLYSGGWTKKTYKINGTWSIEKDGDKTLLKLSDDFKTRRAPDLKIFFSPLSVDQLKNKNAIQDAYFLAPLESNKGGQTYELPADLDLGKYTSVIIHCEAYTKLWGASALTPVNS